jgi:peroxiredoxin (alkyl hydroperoxide reductase subunit C)
MKRKIKVVFLGLVFIFQAGAAFAAEQTFGGMIYDAGTLKATDSALKVRVGEQAPDFTLKSLSGKMISLSDYRGKNNVVISFIPAAWTPVCSEQWPGYNLAQDVFKKHDAVILGISTDTIPALYAWTSQLEGLWFPVLSDFWPHGDVARKYGVLRSDGTADRTIIIVDKKGKIRYIGLHNINKTPPLEEIIHELERIK